MDPFEYTKLIKVTPGQLSKYVSDNPKSTLSLNVSRGYPSYKFDTVYGSFKMYLREIRMSQICVDYIAKHLKGDVYLMLKWTLFDEDDQVTSPGKIDKGKTQFDFTIKSQVEIGQNFVATIHENPIIFQLYATNRKEEVPLCETYVFIDNILETVNTRQKRTVVFNNTQIDSTDHPIAELDTWYKFNCKKKTLKAFMPSNKVDIDKRPSIKSTDMLGEQFTRRSRNFKNIHVTNSEMDHFADSVWLVLNRNKVLKTTQDDINRELQERVRWLRFEANWKQTLQENAILHGRNPEMVFWRQWREENTANVRLRTYDTIKPIVYKPELAITVMDMYFLEGCPLLKNEKVVQLYVEYSFLGYEGPEMETPFSKSKLGAEERITFNFTKHFLIDLEKNLPDCKKLAELIKNDGSVRFLVISEPYEDDDHPIQVCKEMGYADVPLNELIQIEENEDIFEYEIIDTTNNIVILGYLTIKFEGVLAMRKMALDLMAPRNYKLYM